VSLFTWPTRVYWEDTDAGGIVYYANYLRFLERARTEWLRSLGYSQRTLSEEQGLLFAVVNLTVDYRRPARLDDELQVSCAAVADGQVAVRFEQGVYRGNAAPQTLLVQARVRAACLDARTLRPRRLPGFLCEALREPPPDGVHGQSGATVNG
jgi:acyl-CoA thioester hydrolase